MFVNDKMSLTDQQTQTLKYNKICILTELQSRRPLNAQRLKHTVPNDVPKHGKKFVSFSK